MYSFGHYLTIQNGVASFLQIVQIELFALEAFTYSKKKLFFSNVHVWALTTGRAGSSAAHLHTCAHSASHCNSPVFAHGSAQYI